MNDTPQHLDDMVSVVEIKSWIAVATVLIVLGITLVWGFFGTMRVQEDVAGVIVKSGKIFNIYATDDTILLDLNLRPEQYVEKDHVVARIEQLELVSEINLMLAQNASASEIEVMRDELIERSQIRTHDSGRVVDVYVHSGDYVKKGDKIATISKEAPQGAALECFLFMPADQVKQVRKGMQVNVYPASVSKKNYGNMTGVVAYIGEHPVTYQYMFDTLGSDELAREFMKDGAVYEVYVYLDVDEETVTGYRWTTSVGPSKKFGNLTLCDTSVIIEKLRPIDVFFFDA
ncbi:MAG: biotin/lipoyl-binding protein [Lachnospiraceae bacterium]|jgi:biotin carboxyl carrier protein|nr:biotin/lipoyl-binding protein [Lachnospiraceae bacterium]